MMPSLSAFLSSGGSSGMNMPASLAWARAMSSGVIGSIAASTWASALASMELLTLAWISVRAASQCSGGSERTSCVALRTNSGRSAALTSPMPSGGIIAATRVAMSSMAARFSSSVTGAFLIMAGASGPSSSTIRCSACAFTPLSREAATTSWPRSTTSSRASRMRNASARNWPLTAAIMASLGLRESLRLTYSCLTFALASSTSR